MAEAFFGGEMAAAEPQSTNGADMADTAGVLDQMTFEHDRAGAIIGMRV